MKQAQPGVSPAGGIFIGSPNVFSRRQRRRKARSSPWPLSLALCCRAAAEVSLPCLEYGGLRRLNIICRGIVFGRELETGSFPKHKPFGLHWERPNLP